MSAADSSLDRPFHRLRELRNGLLRLHKALLESERAAYEQEHGQIRNRGEFFQLVVGDEWFSWLRPFSQFIVQIDELLSNKGDPATLDQANELIDEAKLLLHADENGTANEQRYYQAIQRDPDIAFMHAELYSIASQK